MPLLLQIGLAVKGIDCEPEPQPGQKRRKPRWRVWCCYQQVICVRACLKKHVLPASWRVFFSSLLENSQGAFLYLNKSKQQPHQDKLSPTAYLTGTCFVSNGTWREQSVHGVHLLTARKCDMLSKRGKNVSWYRHMIFCLGGHSSRSTFPAVWMNEYEIKERAMRSDTWRWWVTDPILSLAAGKQD